MNDSRWAVSRSAGVEIHAGTYRSVLEHHRDRIIATAQAVPDDRWGDPSRCGDWSIHQTFRHLTDGVQLQCSSFTGEAPFELDEGGDFDPNTTPNEWLRFSDSESPAETLERFSHYMAVGSEASVDALGAGLERRVDGPYGDAHWSAISCHVFWDSWIHQRDMAVPLGIEIPEEAQTRRLAAMYGLLMCGVPAVRMGHTFNEVVRFETDAEPIVLNVAATVDDLIVTDLGPDTPSEIAGPLLPAVDAMAGRGLPITDVLSGPTDRVEGLGFLGTVFRGRT